MYIQNPQTQLSPFAANDSHSNFDQKIEIWNSECGMKIKTIFLSSS